jgi:hypothetical protein
LYSKSINMNTFESFLEMTKINGKTINVYGVWDSEEDYDDGNDPEFYDVYEADGMTQIHLNEGDPFFEKPTVTDCENLLNEYYK